MKSIAQITVSLKYCVFDVDCYLHEVATIFPEGQVAIAIRDLGNQDNIREAQSQGYSGPDAVWKSLVEHEYLHSLISEILYDRPSLVLETESGGKFHPSWLRYQEEAVVIGVQYLLNVNSNHNPNLWDETWNLVYSQVRRTNRLDWLLPKCQIAITSLWSQIEKDSQ
jgi:hypothetical protein